MFSDGNNFDDQFHIDTFGGINEDEDCVLIADSYSDSETYIFDDECNTLLFFICEFLSAE